MELQVFEEFGKTTMYHMDLKSRKACHDVHPTMAMPEKVVQVACLSLHWHEGKQVVKKYNLENNVAFTVDDKEMLVYMKSNLPSATILASINVSYDS